MQTLQGRRVHRYDFCYSPTSGEIKMWEYNTKAFFLFIDLRKAYSLIPHETIWLANAKLGVPNSTIQLIQSFHQDMYATIKLDGNTLDPIAVENGLRQGCCMAPVLFNLYTMLDECNLTLTEE